MALQTARERIATALPRLENPDLSAQPTALSESSSPSSTRILPVALRLLSWADLSLYLERPYVSEALDRPLAEDVIHEGPSLRLATEGDVARFSALYLTHPINLFIEKYILPQYRQQPTFLCLDQYYINGFGRNYPDLVYKMNNRIILILEYKRA